MKTLNNNMLAAALVAGTLSYTPSGLAALENPEHAQQQIVAEEIQQRSFETPYSDYRNPTVKLSTAELVHNPGTMLIDTSESKDNWMLMINNSEALGYSSGLHLKNSLKKDEQFMQHFENIEQASPYLDAVEYHMDAFKNKLMSADVAAPFKRDKDNIPTDLTEAEYLERANGYANFDVFTLDERFFNFLHDTFKEIAPPEHARAIMQYTEAFGVLHEIEHTNEHNASLRKESLFAEQQGDAYASVSFFIRSEIESDLTPLVLTYKDMLANNESPEAIDAFGETVSLWRINDTNHGLWSRLRYYYSKNKDDLTLSHDGKSHVFDKHDNLMNHAQRQTHISDIPILAMTAITQQNPSYIQDIDFHQSRALSIATTQAFMELPEIQKLVRSNRLSTGHHFTLEEREQLATELAEQIADKEGLVFQGAVQYPDFSQSTDGPSVKKIQDAGFSRVLTQAPKESPLLAASFWVPKNEHTPLANAVIRTHPYDASPPLLLVAVPQNTYNMVSMASVYSNVPAVFYSHTLHGEGDSYFLIHLDEENGAKQVQALAREMASNGIKSVPLVTNEKMLGFMPELSIYQDVTPDDDRTLKEVLDQIQVDSSQLTPPTPEQSDVELSLRRR